jgi:hypothetical protein
LLRGRGYVEHSNQWHGEDLARPLAVRRAAIDMIEIVEPVDGARCLRLWLRTGVTVIVFPDPHGWTQAREWTHAERDPAVEWQPAAPVVRLASAPGPVEGQDRIARCYACGRPFP